MYTTGKTDILKIIVYIHTHKDKYLFIYLVFGLIH